LQAGRHLLLFATTVREVCRLQGKPVLKPRPVNTLSFQSSWQQQVKTFWTPLLIRCRWRDSVGAIFVPGILADPIDFTFFGCKALYANSCLLYKSMQIFRMLVLRR